MDRSLLSRPDDDPRLFVIDIKQWIQILFFVSIIPVFCFLIYMGFMNLQNAGRIKFAMEPVVYAGLDTVPAGQSLPPSFNVTLYAKSTYRWVKFCSSGRAMMKVTYSGVTLGMADVEPFCVEPKGDKVIRATASTGWPVLPSVFGERMASDRRHGGIPVEVGFSFVNKEQAHPYVKQTWWVQCRAKLDADQDQPSTCESHTVRGC